MINAQINNIKRGRVRINAFVYAQINYDSSILIVINLSKF